MTYRGLLPGLTLAAVLQNLGPDQTFIDKAQASPLPTNLKLGAAYRVLHTDYNNIFVTADQKHAVKVKKYGNLTLMKNLS